MVAYAPQANGTLIQTEARYSDGELCDHYGFPLTRTEETVALKGWAFEDARVYLNTGGQRIYLPEPLPAPSRKPTRAV